MTPPLYLRMGSPLKMSVGSKGQGADCIISRDSRSGSQLSESKAQEYELVRRIVLFLAVLGIMALTFLLATPYGPHRETFVEIAPGTSSLQIAQELEFLGVIRSRYGFDFWRLATGFSRGGTLK